MILGWSEALFLCTDCEREQDAERIPEQSRQHDTLMGGFSVMFNPLSESDDDSIVVACPRHPDSRMLLKFSELDAFRITQKVVMRRP